MPKKQPNPDVQNNAEHEQRVRLLEEKVNEIIATNASQVKETVEARWFEFTADELEKLSADSITEVDFAFDSGEKAVEDLALAMAAIRLTLEKIMAQRELNKEKIAHLADKASQMAEGQRQSLEGAKKHFANAERAFNEAQVKGDSAEIDRAALELAIATAVLERVSAQGERRWLPSRESVKAAFRKYILRKDDAREKELRELNEEQVLDEIIKLVQLELPPDVDQDKAEKAVRTGWKKRIFGDKTLADIAKDAGWGLATGVVVGNTLRTVIKLAIGPGMVASGIAGSAYSSLMAYRRESAGRRHFERLDKKINVEADLVAAYLELQKFKGRGKEFQREYIAQLLVERTVRWNDEINELTSKKDTFSSEEEFNQAIDSIKIRIALFKEGVTKLVKNIEEVEKEKGNADKLKKFMKLRNPFDIESQAMSIGEHLDAIEQVEKDLETSTGRKIRWGNVGRAAMIGAVSGAVGYGVSRWFAGDFDISDTIFGKADGTEVIGSAAAVDSAGATPIPGTVGASAPIPGEIGQLRQPISGEIGQVQEGGLFGTSLKRPSWWPEPAKPFEAVTPDTTAADAAAGAAPVTPGIPVTPEVTAELSELQVVKPGEGFYHRVSAQLNEWVTSHPDKLPDGIRPGTSEYRRYLDQRVMEILRSEGIIKPDGTEIRVRTPGVRIILNPETGDVTLPKSEDLYAWSRSRGNFSYSEFGGNEPSAAAAETPTGANAAETVRGSVAVRPEASSMDASAGLPENPTVTLANGEVFAETRMMGRHSNTMYSFEHVLYIPNDSTPDHVANLVLGGEIPGTADVASVDIGSIEMDQISEVLLQSSAEQRQNWLFRGLENIRLTDNSAVFSETDAFNISSEIGKGNYTNAANLLFGEYQTALDTGNLRHDDAAKRTVMRLAAAIVGGEGRANQLFEEFVLNRQAAAVVQ